MMLHRQRQHAARSDERRPGAGRAGFTLIELLVVISLIAVLLVLVLTGLNRATKTARRTASERSAAALAQAVDQFKAEFGFLPPLVHDGEILSGGDASFTPKGIDGSPSAPGPIQEVTGGPYRYARIVVWSEGLDFNFLRRRSDTGADDIALSSGGSVWNDQGAWEDRRYSKYSLAYYLLGVLDKDVDGVRGPGFARPIIDGSFLGVGYPVGSVRDRFDPLMDVERRGARVSFDYVEPNEGPEHDLGTPVRDYEAVRNDYAEYQKPALVSIVDGFGKAFRYYRWEPGRFVNGRLVVRDVLDMNIPAVLIDPVLYAQVMNDPANLTLMGGIDLTGGDTKLRDARYAIVSAGPDGLFGVESIETIAAHLRVEVPSSLREQAILRQQVWADNAAEIGN